MSTSQRLWFRGFCLAVCLLLVAPIGRIPQPSFAQAPACSPESEPNNVEAEAEEKAGEFCVTGQLPETADQELIVWTVSEDDAKFLWTLTLTGVAQTVTGAKIFALASEPGVRPILAGSQLGEIASAPDTVGPVSGSFLVAPGEYIVGLSRTDRSDAAVPTDTSWQLSLARGERLPKRLDKEPNDDQETATPIEGVVSLAGDLNGSGDTFVWTVSEDDTNSGWEMHLKAAIGTKPNMTIRDAAGAQVVYIDGDRFFAIDLYDLAFAPGQYYLEIRPQAEQATPYLLSIVQADAPVGDVEPNNEQQFASPLDPANPIVKGRLAATDDIDLYRLTVNDELAGSLIDLRVLTTSENNRRICLTSVELGTDLKCAEGPGGAVISNLLLPRGDYVVRISGSTDADDQYILRFDLTSPPSPEFETEPNDNLEFASPLDATTPIRGKFDLGDYDMFRITISGEPQLWDVIAEGTGILDFDYVRRDGTELMTASLAADNTGGRMSDLYLTPGDHWLRIRGDSGKYTITLTPMGPPPEDGEHETNNSALTAEPIQIEQQVTGRLVDATDVDTFRFSLAAPEHISLAMDVPDDAAYRVMVDWGRGRVADGSQSNPGVPINFDLMLEAGDYVITLSPVQVSAQRYALILNREDPFTVSDDQEPNATFATAQVLTPGQTVSGRIGGMDSIDMYQIPAGPDRDLTFPFTGDGVYYSLSDDENNYYSIVLNADGTAYEIDQRVSDDVPLFLQLSGEGAYMFGYGSADNAPANGPQLPGFLSGGDKESLLSVSVTLDATEVAAYWEEAQRVNGVMTLENSGESDLAVVLSTATTHFGFTVLLSPEPVVVPAGSSITVPVSIDIDPDAWADIPVRITVLAEGDGQRSTGSVEITPTAAAVPVNPNYAWPIPAAMLGGLNLASPALGAIPAGTIDPTGEALLYDGVAPVGSGLYLNAPVLPVEVTTDLAGDAPAPIVGFIINNQTQTGVPQDQMRSFEFQVSTDGVTFETVYAGELGALVRDYVFALEEPVQSSFARLRILTGYDQVPESPYYLSIGEWSVIAEPGYVPETLGQINIADWANGGYVVRADPVFVNPDATISMLTADGLLQTFSTNNLASFNWVVGFADDRAAQMTDMEWLDAIETDPTQQISSVTVEISMGTATGPWESIGTWDLTRGSDGRIDLFEFDDPTWARYVRFTGSVTEGVFTLEYPEQLVIHEAPISSDYRSVLGAFGSVNPAGYYEVLNPPAIADVSDDQDAPDDAANALGLDLGQTIKGRAQVDTDVDWYRVTAPRRDNTLVFTLTGTPTVDVVVRLYNTDNVEVPVQREIQGDTSTIAYSATVEPGEDYLLRVEQPPHSIVFAFDTSGSMGSYAPLVQQSLRSFASGIKEGQEFVQVMAFDEDPLLETWTDNSYVVYSAINGYYDKSLSSSAETAILDSTELLADQEGTTAILMITDAETSSWTESAKMWAAVDVVQPRIFAVHVGGSTTPVLNEHLMQSWSSLGGYYQYTTNQSEMDRAFDRAATWLRRPAAYGLTVSSDLIEEATPTPEPTATPAAPAQLSIVSGQPSGETGAPAAQISDAVTIEIILDTSGSMLAGMPDGQRRIDVARNVLTDLVTNQLPAGVPITLRVFGNTPDSCDTSLLVPVQPLDPQTMADTIRAIEPVNLVRTPIGASLEQVANDLAGVSGPKIVVLVTDGEETCDGDPAAAIQSLKDQGVDVQVNIVGFALDDDALRDQFREWAAIGDGTYFDATNSDELDDAIAKAVRAPYRVLDADGNQIAAGTVDGDPVELPPGTYTVVVLTDPEQRFEAVVVEPGKALELTLEE